MPDHKIRLGGLWKQKSKTGVDYLAGSFGQARLLVFKNDLKQNDSSPDYTMYIVPDDRQLAPEPGEGPPAGKPY